MENKSDDILRSFEVCDYDLNSLIRELMKHGYEIRLCPFKYFLEDKQTYKLDLIHGVKVARALIDGHDYEQLNFDHKNILLILLDEINKIEDEANGNNC